MRGTVSDIVGQSGDHSDARGGRSGDRREAAV